MQKLGITERKKKYTLAGVFRFADLAKMTK